MNKRVVFSTQAKADLAGLDRSVALRIIKAINRFAITGAGNVQGLARHPSARVPATGWTVPCPVS